MAATSAKTSASHGADAEPKGKAETLNDPARPANAAGKTGGGGKTPR